MKLSVVGPVPPLRGGIAHHTASLVTALRAEGADVDVISYRRLYPRALFPGRDEEAPGEAMTSARLLTSLNPARWLLAARRVIARSPALVVVPYWHSLFLPGLVTLLSLCRAARVPTLVVAHNLTSHERGVLDGAALRAIARLPAAVLVHSETHERALRRAGASLEVLRVPHPAYTRFLPRGDQPFAARRAAARRALGLSVGERVLLLFGLVRGYKGVDVALDALAALPDAYRLIIAGESYLPRGALERAVVERGLGQRVLLHDRYVADDEVHRYFDAADVLLAPYRSASQSGPVGIARAFGLPVVAAAVGGLSEQVSPADGLLVPPGDPRALSAAVLSLTGQPRPTRPAPDDDGWRDMARRVVALAERAGRGA